MSAVQVYECGPLPDFGCGRTVERELLTVKRAVFMEPGEGAKTLRSRVIAHLCPECVAKDLDWNRPPHQRLVAVESMAQGA